MEDGSKIIIIIIVAKPKGYQSRLCCPSRKTKTRIHVVEIFIEQET